MNSFFKLLTIALIAIMATTDPCTSDQMDHSSIYDVEEFEAQDFQDIVNGTTITNDKVLNFSPFCCKSENFAEVVTSIAEQDSTSIGVSSSYIKIQNEMTKYNAEITKMLDDANFQEKMIPYFIDLINKEEEEQEINVPQFIGENYPKVFFPGCFDYVENPEILNQLTQINEFTKSLEINNWYAKCSQAYQKIQEVDSSVAPYTLLTFEEKKNSLAAAIANIDLFLNLLPFYKKLLALAYITETCTDCLNVLMYEGVEGIINKLKEWFTIVNVEGVDCNEDCQNLMNELPIELLNNFAEMNRTFLSEGESVMERLPEYLGIELEIMDNDDLGNQSVLMTDNFEDQSIDHRPGDKNQPILLRV